MKKRKRLTKAERLRLRLRDKARADALQRALISSRGGSLHEAERKRRRWMIILRWLGGLFG